MDDDGRRDLRDIDTILEFRTTGAIGGLLPTGLLLILIGLSLLVLADAADKPMGLDGLIMIPVCLLTGVAVLAYALWTLSRSGKPIYALSPAGILYRVPSNRTFLIPWSEIRAVESITIASRQFNPVSLFQSGHLLYRMSMFHDVTVVTVSKAFYDAHIHVSSFFRRGPGWKATFIPHGEQVQVALHHYLASVEPSEMRQAVEARWRAFHEQTGHGSARGNSVRNPSGDATVAALPGGSAQPSAVGVGRTNLSGFQIAQTAILASGIVIAMANLAGLWRLDGQDAARQARALATAERQKRVDAQKALLEETKQRDAALQELRRQSEDHLRRAFGR